MAGQLPARLVRWLDDLASTRLQAADQRLLEQQVVSTVLAGGGNLELTPAQFQRLAPDLRRFIRKVGRRRCHPRAMAQRPRKRPCSSEDSPQSPSPPPAGTAGRRTGWRHRSLQPFLISIRDYAAENPMSQLEEREAVIQEIVQIMDDPSLAGPVAPGRHFSVAQWAALSPAAKAFIAAAGRRERERRRRHRGRRRKSKCRSGHETEDQDFFFWR